MPVRKPVSIAKLARYPRMTSWFNPALLVRLVWQVVVSELFGQFADSRLIVAALDPVKEDELCRRARQFLPDGCNPNWSFTPDAEGAVWVDFVADLADGFDATYAIACLLARDTLEVDGHKLPRGQMLVMGGDEIYPHATAENYQTKLRDPFDWAFPDPAPKSDTGPPVYAIPGNHDWYDGLVLFLSLFSRKEHLHLGGWRSHQRRSYFALQLTETWWIWGIDAQLADDIDQPQTDYFQAIARSMAPGSNIILCGPEPGWLYTLKQGCKSLHVMDYVARIAVERCRGAAIPIVLSGDTHHYSRYVGDDGNTQFITSGGGGAFLHPTHQLRNRVDLDRDSEGVSWLCGLDGALKALSLGRKGAAPGTRAPPACYPSREESAAMLRGNWAFPVRNPGFAVLLGAVYLVCAIAYELLPWGWELAVPIVLAGGFLAYTKRQEGTANTAVWCWSIANGLMHGAAAFGLMRLFSGLNNHLSAVAGFLFAMAMIGAGGLVAAFLFAAYLSISSRWFDINHNDAFSAMRRDSHRGFLRIRIKGDQATIFPIGLDRPPSRSDWRKVPSITPGPAFVPRMPLEPRLIEPPVQVRAVLRQS